jgi:hypothetical protein
MRLLIANFLQPALPTEKVDEHSYQNDDEHDPGNGRAHKRIRGLKLREIPHVGFKINFQTNPMITTDKMVGVKMIVR